MNLARNEAWMLHGTDEPPAEKVRLVVGNLDAELAGGALRHIRWRGVELIRGIECLVRDSEWKTEPFADIAESCANNGEGFRCERSFTAMQGALHGTVSFSGGANGLLRADLHVAVERDVSVNRVGFVVYHPVRNLAGKAVQVSHTDGTEEASRFADLVMPSQPARNIAGLAYADAGAEIRIAFAGDVFEMEDQRNWSDASFKTYSRPLDLPHPYRLAAGTTVDQAINIAFSGQGAAPVTGAARGPWARALGGLGAARAR